MARDIRNVKRGSCNNCTSCTNYISLSGKVLCDYCGCPPAKHDQLEDAEERPDDGETAPQTRDRSDPDNDPDNDEAPERDDRDETKGRWSRAQFA